MSVLMTALEKLSRAEKWLAEYMGRRNSRMFMIMIKEMGETVPHTKAIQCKRDLYFFKKGDLIKIGQSVDVEQRLKNLQSKYTDLIFLFEIIKKAGSRESYCHKKLSNLRIKGEWFLHTKEVDELIVELQRSTKGHENE